MSGNVVEWVFDTAILDDEYEFTGGSRYPFRGQIDPVCVDTSGSERVNRGGSWGNVSGISRVSLRDRFDASSRDFNLGFRILRPV